MFVFSFNVNIRSTLFHLLCKDSNIICSGKTHSSRISLLLYRFGNFLLHKYIHKEKYIKKKNSQKLH